MAKILRNNRASQLCGTMSSSTKCMANSHTSRWSFACRRQKPFIAFPVASKWTCWTVFRPGLHQTRYGLTSILQGRSNVRKKLISYRARSSPNWSKLDLAMHKNFVSGNEKLPLSIAIPLSVIHYTVFETFRNHKCQRRWITGGVAVPSLACILTSTIRCNGGTQTRQR